MLRLPFCDLRVLSRLIIPFLSRFLQDVSTHLTHLTHLTYSSASARTSLLEIPKSAFITLWKQALLWKSIVHVPVHECQTNSIVSCQMRIIAYIFLVPLSLSGASFLWDAFAVDRLFHCSDSLGPLDFIPPFVHNCPGDHYIAPAWIVWTLWVGLVALVIGLPALVFRGAFPDYEHPPTKQKSS